MNSKQVTLRCESCGKQVGTEIINCPERSSGRCPYVLIRGGPGQKRRLPMWSLGMSIAMSSVVIPLVLLYTSVLAVEPVPWLPILGGTLLCVVGPVVLFVLSSRAMRGDQVTLFDPTTGATWHRRRWLGKEREQVVVTSVEPLASNVSLRRSLDYPPSVVALSMAVLDGFGESASRATGILETALVGLLARGLIGMRRAIVYRSRSGGPLELVQSTGASKIPSWLAKLGEITGQFTLPESAPLVGEYLVVSTEDAGEAQVDGLLEQRIMRVVRDWEKHPAAQCWPQGPTVRELVRAVYRRNYDFPRLWLTRLVERDITARGLGKRRIGLFEHRFELDPSCASELWREAGTIRAWYERLTQAQPGFVLELGDQVKRGIDSRRRELD